MVNRARRGPGHGTTLPTGCDTRRARERGLVRWASGQPCGASWLVGGKVATSTDESATATTTRGVRLQFRRGTTDTPQVNHTRRRARTGKHRSWAARRRNDEGATMVEAAFVMPIFVLFLFGIIEFSGFLLSKEGTTNAVQAGARTASVQGNDAMADQQILVRLARRGGRHPERRDQADHHLARLGPNDTRPATCPAGTGVETACRSAGQRATRRSASPTRSMPATSTTTRRPLVARSSWPRARHSANLSSAARSCLRRRAVPRLQLDPGAPHERHSRSPAPATRT